MEKEEIKKRWGKFRWVFWVVIFSPIIVSTLFFLIAPGFISDISENTLLYITSTIGFVAMIMHLWLFIYSIRFAIFLSGKKVTGVYIFLLSIVGVLGIPIMEPVIVFVGYLIVFVPLIWFYIWSLKNKALKVLT